MERSIKMKIIVSLFLLLMLNTASAQNKVSLPKAFAESYAYEQKYEYLKAIESIKKVYKTDSYEMNLRLGWLYYQAKNYKESLNYYNKAIMILPLSIEAKLGYAFPAYAMGNKELVIKKYKEILAIDPNNYYGNYRLGSLYFERQDYQEANRHFDKLINLYPFDYDVMIMSAWTYFRLNKLREAKVLFNKALLNRPDDVSASEGLSLIK